VVEPFPLEHMFQTPFRDFTRSRSALGQAAKTFCNASHPTATDPVQVTSQGRAWCRASSFRAFPFGRISNHGILNLVGSASLPELKGAVCGRADFMQIKSKGFKHPGLCNGRVFATLKTQIMAASRQRPYPPTAPCDKDNILPPLFGSLPPFSTTGHLQ